MTTSLAPLAPSVEAATAALAPARATYGRFGYDKGLEAELIKRLTTPAEDERKQRRTVQGIRDLLWNYFPGGGTASSVARNVMRELGHEEFATAKWL